VSRREKLIEKMRRTLGSIRFAEVEALLRHQGIVLFNTRGSHRTYHDASGRVLTIVGRTEVERLAIPTTSRHSWRSWGYDDHDPCLSRLCVHHHLLSGGARLHRPVRGYSGDHHQRRDVDRGVRPRL